MGDNGGLALEIRIGYKFRVHHPLLSGLGNSQMSLLDGLTCEGLTLMKVNGEKRTFIGHAQPKLIITTDTSLPVEEGDTIERLLPNGMSAGWIVEEANLYRALGSIADHYQLKIRKASQLRAAPSGVTNIYNVQGPNARVNVQSTDQSRNVANVTEPELFERLRTSLRGSPEAEQEIGQLVEAVNLLEASVGTTSFALTFQQFMALSANVVTVITPFLPALSQFLA